MKPNEGASRQAGILTMQGELTVQYAMELKSALVEAMESQDHVILDFDEVTQADLSFLQMVCSAHLASVAANKRLTLSGAPPEVIERALKAAGYVHSKCCLAGLQNECLWQRSHVQAC